MKEVLTKIFSHYGNVVEVIAKGSLKRKGQAFVVFDNHQSALKAAEEMNGFVMNNKPIKTAMARSHSDATVKRKAPEEQFEQHKRERLTMKGSSLINTC